MLALFKKAHLKTVLAILLPVFLISCSTQKYIAKPLDPTANTAKFERKAPSDSEFQQYLISNGYTADQLPLQLWGLDELTYCALFFHPSLNVSRAQWRAALQAETTASEHPTPNISGHLAHSDDPDPAKKPFALGLSIDIPIETANKRDIRIENAKHLSQAAKLEIAQTAWQLRNDIAQTLSEYQFNQQHTYLLAKEQNYRQSIVNIFQKRVELGEASKIELSNAQLQLQAITTALNLNLQNNLVLQSRLASNLGLPTTQVANIQISPEDSRQSIEVPVQNLQANALLNRLDIRIALARYSAAEAKLKLEIAKQYPDLVISPGYAFEFGDNVWSLGLSSLLSLLNKNKVNIAEATQLREVEATQFEALQTKVISEASTANAEVSQAKLTLSKQQALHALQLAIFQRLERKFSAGEADRLELTLAQLENINAEKNLVSAKFQLSKALNQLENAIQQPLISKMNISTTINENTAKESEK